MDILLIIGIVIAVIVINWLLTYSMVELYGDSK